MKKILVYADFDWLKNITLLGELSYKTILGYENYGFTFDKK